VLCAGIKRKLAATSKTGALGGMGDKIDVALLHFSLCFPYPGQFRRQNDGFMDGCGISKLLLADGTTL
jgi:hypothetical protein